MWKKRDNWPVVWITNPDKYERKMSAWTISIFIICKKSKTSSEDTSHGFDTFSSSGIRPIQIYVISPNCDIYSIYTHKYVSGLNFLHDWPSVKRRHSRKTTTTGRESNSLKTGTHKTLIFWLHKGQETFLSGREQKSVRLQQRLGGN